jgi:hypothetical protein
MLPSDRIAGNVRPIHPVGYADAKPEIKQVGMVASREHPRDISCAARFQAFATTKTGGSFCRRAGTVVAQKTVMVTRSQTTSPSDDGIVWPPPAREADKPLRDMA